jgi:diguanylate cyclase (GGDEF)-like protein
MQPKYQTLLPEAVTATGSDTLAAGAGNGLAAEFEHLQEATIMMVDDEMITMEVVQTFLEDAGYRRFVLIEDSVKAMEALHEHRPDVLLLDVMMPEVNGFEILAMLRRDPEFSHLPVIILTSSSDAATKLQALDLGATDFLSKPVDPSELALRLRNTLAAKAYQDQLAYYDVLTNLPNRNLFQDRCHWAIQRAEREDSQVAMLHVAFEDFKRITDSFGPKTGDEVLKQLAERLTGMLRASDSVGRRSKEDTAWLDIFRLGSADFSVLLPAVDSIPRAAAIGQRILDMMREPLDADGTEVYLTPCVGIAGFPDDAGDALSLTRYAMAASSQAFAQGGGRLQFYSAEMNTNSLQRLRMEADLRRAIDNGEFRLLYQPKVGVASGRIVGAEALIRWHRADGSVESPADFIPVAEETGLILPIGEWVLRAGCAQLAAWQRQGMEFGLSVNISARQFFESDLVGLISLTLAEAQVAASQLTLEMTESILIDRPEQALEILKQLRQLGVRISIDDFGTGYSSLSYLKRFQADEVKIDRAFITDVATSKEDRALVYAVTFLAHEFGFRVCAEGVENPAQLEFVSNIRCDEYQGFYFSRPISPEALAELYADGAG